MSDQRESHRVPVSFDTLFSEGRQAGAGQLSDLSYTGAHVHGASIVPRIGSSVRLFVFIQPVAPFEILGEVVRHSEDGFALRFKNLSDEVRALVDDAAAIVTSI